MEEQGPLQASLRWAGISPRGIKAGGGLAVEQQLTVNEKRDQNSKNKGSAGQNIEVLIGRVKSFILDHPKAKGIIPLQVEDKLSVTFYMTQPISLRLHFR